MFPSRYFVSNCARSVNVTRSGLALPLAVRLICIHTWKSGLQQGSPAPSFFIVSITYLGWKICFCEKKPSHQTNWGHTIPRNARFHLRGGFFFPLKGRFEKQEGFVLGLTSPLHCRLRGVRGASLPEEELVLREHRLSQHM